ncbi:MAG: hypothetical protein N3A01_04100 [Bacteroidales bacterium]|nr:hypothetical protein [Bacteroidales bacterium]
MIKKVITITIFSIAMAFLEGAVVVYLRELYYPHGFKFPLNTQIPINILVTEWIRELSTIIMLMSVGFIAGKNFNSKFAYFLISFGIWDIFYYVALKIFLNWPESLLTWDLLFLIPVAWVGPVLAPILCSLLMIILGTIIILFEEYYLKNIKISLIDWSLIFSGAIIVFVTFIWDYLTLIVKGGFLNNTSNLLSNQMFIQAVQSYVPINFYWGSFLLGLTLIGIAISRIFYKYLKS